MEIETTAELALTRAQETEIGALIVRVWPDSDGRTWCRQRHHLRLVARDGGAVIGHMALGLRAVRLGGRLVESASLAEVCTDPARRGEGIAARLLERALSAARGSLADVALLFGDARLYVAACFRQMTLPLVCLGLDGARSGKLCREAATNHLMVLELGDLRWQDGAELDLMGGLF